tara:strand:+ start:7615 stop:8667 length:1053 start_codon:yes stop_codon:yes gene_type:complete
MREGLTNDESEATDDADHANHKYLGQTYYYHKNITGPEDLGMTPEGSIDALIKNVSGLINYGQILITGSGHANAKVNREGRDEPLGDKFFMKTMGKCYKVKHDKGVPVTALWSEDGEGAMVPGPNGETSEKPLLCSQRDQNDEGNGNKCDFIYYKPTDDKIAGGTEVIDKLKDPKHEEDRYVYIDNLPTGTILGLGELKGMRGLIPGMIENLSVFNPMGLLNSITAPAVPPCLELNMEVIKFIDEGNNPNDWRHEYTTDTHYVSLSDASDISPCSFSKENGKNKNTITGDTKNDCPKHVTEQFANLFVNDGDDKRKLMLSDKPIAKMFNVSFGLLLAYLLWKVLKKESNY